MDNIYSLPSTVYMADSKVPILSQKYVPSVLMFLLDQGTVHKTELTSVTHSNTLIDKLLTELKNEDLVEVRKEFAGRNTYFISLTGKGKRVAEQLSKAEAARRDTDLNPSLELTAEEVEMTERLTPLFHINVMDDHITVQENPPGQASRVFNIYIKRNGNGYFRLWCEQDNSFDCWHVKAAWTYPHVQKMMMEYQGKVKICPVCGAENRERAKFCDQCGEKL